MKKGIIFIVLMSMLCLSGCQGAVRSYGGEMTLDLPVDTKLIKIYNLNHNSEDTAYINTNFISSIDEKITGTRI